MRDGNKSLGDPPAGCRRLYRFVFQPCKGVRLVKGIRFRISFTSRFDCAGKMVASGVRSPSQDDTIATIIRYNCNSSVPLKNDSGNGQIAELDSGAAEGEYRE